MRHSTFPNRSLSWSSINLRRASTLTLHEKRDLVHIRQGRLAPFPETQGSSCHLRTLARSFSLAQPDKLLDLPRSCPGCGAFTQSTNPDQAGFYGANRKAVQAFIAWSRNVQTGLGEKGSGPTLGLTYRYFPEQLNNHQGLDFSTGLLKPFG